MLSGAIFRLVIIRAIAGVATITLHALKGMLDQLPDVSDSAGRARDDWDRLTKKNDEAAQPDETEEQPPPAAFPASSEEPPAAAQVVLGFRGVSERTRPRPGAPGARQAHERPREIPPVASCSMRGWLRRRCPTRNRTGARGVRTERGVGPPFTRAVGRGPPMSVRRRSRGLDAGSRPRSPLAHRVRFGCGAGAGRS